MDDLLRQSKEIYEFAVAEFKPKAVVLMFSGGDDSRATYEVCKALNIKLDFVIHGNTRTGIEETTTYARSVVEGYGDNYIEADAGNSYVDYVLRKGFFGKGEDAHNFSYHVLKAGHFRSVVSKNLRQRKRNFPILFLNGARRDESDRRKTTMVIPYKIDKGAKQNIWVNLINDWSNTDVKDYLDGNGCARNPVSKLLCRSGECMCGTMQSQGDRFEAGFHFPKWKKWIDELEIVVKEKHGYGWNDKGPPKVYPGQLNLFQPMCTGCKINFKDEKRS